MSAETLAAGLRTIRNMAGAFEDTKLRSEGGLCMCDAEVCVVHDVLKEARQALAAHEQEQRPIRYLAGMREWQAAVEEWPVRMNEVTTWDQPTCWAIVGNDDYTCILPLGHDDGEHEQEQQVSESLPPRLREVGGQPLRPVGADWNRITEQVQELSKKAQDAQRCDRCHGKREILVPTYPGQVDPDNHWVPCPACCSECGGTGAKSVYVGNVGGSTPCPRCKGGAK